MSRNIVIVIILLILALVSGYLVWLRSQLAPQFSAPIQKVEDIESSSPLPEATQQVPPLPTASASATPRSASPSATPRR